jgi:hypothetical protein
MELLLKVRKTKINQEIVQLLPKDKKLKIVEKTLSLKVHFL